MEVVEQIIPGATLLELRGELDFSSRQEFMNAIHHASNSSYTHVIVDLQGITCSDDSAISLLVIAHQKLVQHHCRLSLLNPSEKLSGKLHSLKFPRIIPIYTSVEEALIRQIFPFTRVK